MVNKTQSKVNASIKWKSENNKAGVYFCRISVDGYVQNYKVIYLPLQ
jgi:hypothetical protein